MKILFLDDDEERHDVTRALWGQYCPAAEVTWVRTVEEAVAALDSEGRFDIAFLDHDLEGRIYVKEVEGTGTMVAIHIAGMPADKQPLQTVVHSFNLDGAQRMMQELRKGGSRCDKCYWNGDLFRAKWGCDKPQPRRW